MEVKNGEESPGKKDHQLLAGSPGRLEVLSLTDLQGLAVSKHCSDSRINFVTPHIAGEGTTLDVSSEIRKMIF